MCLVRRVAQGGGMPWLVFVSAMRVFHIACWFDPPRVIWRTFLTRINSFGFHIVRSVQHYCSYSSIIIILCNTWYNAIVFFWWLRVQCERSLWFWRLAICHVASLPLHSYNLHLTSIYRTCFKKKKRFFCFVSFCTVNSQVFLGDPWSQEGRSRLPLRFSRLLIFYCDFLLRFDP